MPEKNYYDILNIDPQADIDTIKRAYRDLMRQNHPDKFAADLARLQKSTDKIGLNALERKIQAAKIQAQRANEAYAILTDADKRQAYDQKLSEKRMQAYQAEIRRQRNRQPDVHRRTVKTRRHRPHKQAQNGALPRVFFGALLIFSLIVFSSFTRIFSRSFGSPVHVPRHPTAVGVVSVLDLQSTQDVINVTNIARTQTANDPTITPLSPEQYERSADRLLSAGLIDSAIDAYSRALQYAPDAAHLYSKRGLAYIFLFVDGDENAAAFALDDFDEALEIDENYAGAYRERGLLYFLLWQQSHDDVAAERALADLQQYQQLTDGSDEIVSEALNSLQTSDE